MRKTPLQLLSLFIAVTLLSCQSGNEEEKTFSSTHPELEQQLERNTVRTPVTSNENPDLYHRYQITMDEFDADNNYKVEEQYSGHMAPLDEGSFAEARTHRSELKSGMDAGINFAGKYTVVTIACGPSCQTHYVVNRENGMVTDKIQSRHGAKYNPNSRLFIVNPPDASINYEECEECAPEAYVFENGQFRKISSQTDNSSL